MRLISFGLIKWNYMKKTLTAILLLVCAFNLQAGKRPLDHSVFDSWQALVSPALSPSGQVITYQVNPQEGDGNLYIRTFGRKGREICIPRGYELSVLDDDSYAVCLIKPYFSETRQARIDKKKGDDMPQDSLAIVNLRTGEIVKYPNVKSFQMSDHGLDAFAFSTSDTSFVAKADRGAKRLGRSLAVYHFASGSIDTLSRVDDYDFSRDGNRLAMVRKSSKDSSYVAIYDVNSRTMCFISDTTGFHDIPVFDEEGRQALYAQADEEADSGSTHAEMWIWREGEGGRRLIGPDEMRRVPEGWGITENSNYYFSDDGRRIFVGIQEFVPEDDTTLVSFETPGLDIWNWDADMIPPFWKANEDDFSEQSFTAAFIGGELVPLYTSFAGTLRLGNRGDSEWVLYYEEVNPIESQWNIYGEKKVELISLNDGSRREIARGCFDSIQISPYAKHVLWWDYAAGQWFAYNITSGQTRCLTEGIGLPFWDETDDRPGYADPCGRGDWLDDDSAVLLYDRYDIWRVPMDGSAPQKLTAGRADKLTYRYIRTKDFEYDRNIRTPETIYMSLFNNVTKENGIARVQLSRPERSFRVIDSGGFSWNHFTKASKADVFFWQKGNFREPMNLWYSTAPGRKDIKLSDINPQISEYNWGDVQLIHWNAFDGTPLDGLLYTPEDFDPSKKYPVIVYFYELYSETLYTHYQVQPMWSIINVPFFVSRGYVVFIPDIVYHSGIPGESAYNCIVSGAQALIDRYSWIDADNMAIQGQSWGGYQVAYLITRTSMFKAAGAGAPVANMTSAYGGIRWESGMSRQFQYEQTQSRIGRDLWSGLGLYMENSPLFGLPNVTTPVLIMHNDNDGAVPWYQGIELFMGLRRLGKPAWLLEYNGEAHNLRQRRNRKDLSIRLQQFFDYYLQGAPEPAWMRDGVPTAKKGYYFGYENAE